MGFLFLFDEVCVRFFEFYVVLVFMYCLVCGVGVVRCFRVKNLFFWEYVVVFVLGCNIVLEFDDVGLVWML